jgi:ribosomal protein S18 acetylase RimI-like enzyme
LRVVRVEVRDYNPNALAFYEALGFRVTGRVPGYYDGVLDAVRLVKRLGVDAAARG